MTRKDYEIIASALYERITELSPNKRAREKALREQHRHMVESVADALQADNPRFDRERFIKACGAE